MPNNTWSALAAGNWNIAENWSLGTVPVAGDDVIFDATSVQNCTINVSPSVNSYTETSAYTGNITFSGQTLTVALGYSFDGTGTHNFGNGLTANGASSTCRFGSTLGTVTATSCTLTMNGTTGMALTFDKIITIKSLIFGTGAVVAKGGAAYCMVQQVIAGSTILVFGNNSTFTNNTVLHLYAVNTTNVNYWSVGTGVTLNGTGAWICSCEYANASANISAITYSGSGAITIANIGAYSIAGPSTFNFTGNVNWGTATFSMYGGANAASTRTYNFGGFNLSCGLLRIGNLGAFGTDVYNFSSGTFNCTAYDGVTYNAGTCTMNFQTSTITVSGQVFFGGNHTHNVGTFTFAITNTSTITSNGKSIYNFVINAAARTITLAGALNIATGGSVTVTAFTAFAGNQYIVFAGSGSISIATAVSNRLRTAVAGSTITWNTGANTWTIPAYTANDWGGSGAGNVLWVSSNPGTKYKIAAPAGVTVSYMTPTDCDNSGGTEIDASDPSNIDGGNNLNWSLPVANKSKKYLLIFAKHQCI